MKTIKSTEEEDEELTETNLPEQSNVIRLAYSSDGSDDPPWLKTLEVGTVFLSRRKPSLGQPGDFTLPEFLKVSNSEKGVRLMQAGGQPGWVDPVKFCAQMDFVEIIGKQHFQEVGDTDGEDSEV